MKAAVSPWRHGPSVAKATNVSLSLSVSYGVLQRFFCPFTRLSLLYQLFGDSFGMLGQWRCNHSVAMVTGFPHKCSSSLGGSFGILLGFFFGEILLGFFRVLQRSLRNGPLSVMPLLSCCHGNRFTERSCSIVFGHCLTMIKGSSTFFLDSFVIFGDISCKKSSKFLGILSVPVIYWTQRNAKIRERILLIWISASGPRDPKKPARIFKNPLGYVDTSSAIAAAIVLADSSCSSWCLTLNGDEKKARPYRRRPF